MAKKDFAETIIKYLDQSKVADLETISALGSSITTVMGTAICLGITEYLITNTLVAVGYSGVIPGSPPTTDPVVADTIPILGSLTSGIDKQDTRDEWFDQIGDLIRDTFSMSVGLLGVTPTATTYPFNTIALHNYISSSDLLDPPVEEGSEEENDIRLATWEVICQGIIDWALIPGVTSTAGQNTKSGSSGTISLLSIVIS